jgi:hypothetical protein
MVLSSNFSIIKEKKGKRVGANQKINFLPVRVTQTESRETHAIFTCGQKSACRPLVLLGGRKGVLVGVELFGTSFPCRPKVLIYPCSCAGQVVHADLSATIPVASAPMAWEPEAAATGSTKLAGPLPSHP